MVSVVELVLGVVLGAVVTELVLLAKAATTEAATFKNRVEDLISDLQILSLKFKELDSSCTQKHEAENLIERGRKLVDECSTVRLLNLVKIKCCASKLKELKSSISKSVMIIDSLVFSQQINFLRNELRELQQRESTVRFESFSVPHFNQTEMDLLEEQEQPVVVSTSVFSRIRGAVNTAEALEAEEPSSVCELAGGASLGTEVPELYQMVEGAIIKSSMFNTQLKQLKSTLESITGLCPERLNGDFDWPSHEILERGKQLLNKCSTVNFWNLPQRYLYARKLVQLDRLILKFFESVVQLQMIRDAKKLRRIRKSWHNKTRRFRNRLHSL